MKKRSGRIISILTALMVALGIFFAAPLTAYAADNTIYLKGSGNNFNGDSWSNLFYLGGAEAYSDPSVWHLVYSENVNNVSAMQLTFTNGEVFNWLPAMGFSRNNGGNNPGWVIVAPPDWELDYIDKGNNQNESGCFVIASDGGQFNVSGFHKGHGTPPPPELYGQIEVPKWVDGISIIDWLLDGDYDLEFISSLFDDITFELYAANADGTAYNPADFIAYGAINVGGVIQFFNGSEQVDVGPGWYALV